MQNKEVDHFASSNHEEHNKHSKNHPNNKPPSPQLDPIEKRVLNKLYLRIIPFLILCYFVAYIDRVNVGFAALTMNQDIGLTASMFGFGATLFFVAYVLFEVPSNMAMEKFGARVWIARIMVTWGIIGFCSAHMIGPISYGISRFLMGAAEAGFFPGVLLYLTFWFPRAYMTRIVAVFMMAVPLSNFFGAPLSAFLLGLDGWLGFKGWQLLLMLESIPAILLGLLCLWMLPNRPNDAKWLTVEERQWLNQRLASDREAQALANASASDLKSSGLKNSNFKNNNLENSNVFKQLLTNRYFWLFSIIYAGSSATSNVLALWMPQILKHHQLDTMQTAMMTMIPFGISAIFMVLWGIRSDLKGDKRTNIALPLVLTSCCLFLSIFFNSLVLSVLFFSLALIGNYAFKGPFWAFVSESMPVRVLAVGIAGVNTLAHVGTGLVNAGVGMIRDASGSFSLSLLPLASLTLVGAMLLLFMGRHLARPKALQSSENVLN